MNKYKISWKEYELKKRNFTYIEKIKRDHSRNSNKYKIIVLLIFLISSLILFILYSIMPELSKEEK